MAATWATARCPTCGASLAALVPSTPGARWFACSHCGSPVPVSPPTDPPPIFSWEVFPQVYPPPPPLRVAGPRIGRLATVALLASVVLLVGLAGALVYGGETALGVSSYSLSGGIVRANTSSPLFNVHVVMVSETHWTQTAYTGLDGRFSFSGIPAGGATLNASAPGYVPMSLRLFFSPSYRATGAGDSGLLINMRPGASANATTVVETPFPDLENFVASLWSASALLGLAAIVAAIGAVMAYRGRHPTVGVAGGLGAAASPAALVLLGVSVAYPLAVAPAAALAGLGVSAAILELLPVVWAGRGPDPD